MRKFFITAIILSALFALPAFADDANLADARQNYQSGNYDTAITLGKELGTVDGLNLAAESISAKVMLGYFEKPRKAATRARKLADKAREMDPNSREAHVQYALARGFESQTSSPFRAWTKKLIPKTRKAIEAVREKYPEDVRGDALMGAWHLGIVRKAGAGRADDFFDATEEDGIRFYEAALSRTPEDIIILSNFSAALLSIDAQKYNGKCQKLIQRIYAAKPLDAVDMEVKTRMLAFKPFMEDTEKLAELADQWLGDENDDSEDE